MKNRRKHFNKIGLDKKGNKNWKSKIVCNALFHLDKTKYFEIYEMQVIFFMVFIRYLVEIFIEIFFQGCAY